MNVWNAPTGGRRVHFFVMFCLKKLWWAKKMSFRGRIKNAVRLKMGAKKVGIHLARAAAVALGQ